MSTGNLASPLLASDSNVTALTFADLSTFDRAFRRRFGDTPTGVRRQGAQGIA